MEKLKEYKFFVLISVVFILLIFWINNSDDRTFNIVLSDQKHIEPQKKDKASSLNEAYESDFSQQESKQKFLTAAEKMIGVIEFEEAIPEKKYISENKTTINHPVSLNEDKYPEKEYPDKVVENKKKKITNKEKKEAPKSETTQKNQEEYWVSVGEARAQRSKKSAKIGYKSAHIETLGEKIKDGDKISIILDEPIQIEEELIPEESELFGTIHFQKKRGIIKITRVIRGSNAMTCNIDAYDMDGYLGIALDISIEQEIASDGVDEGINQAASYGGNASRIAASLVTGAAKKMKADPYIKIENKRKVYLSIN